MRYLSALFFLLGLQASAQRTYTNPVLAGFYPDPSICRVGGDYYLVNSSFAYYPGLPLFHSKDLVNWKPIGHAMNRPGQLPLEGAGVSRGLFAPAISYHKGLFYIVCTLIDRGGNFVITARDPGGPWSDPYWLTDVDGIDPALFFDENDSAYIVYNSVPPDNKSLWDGHRTIRMKAFDWKNLRTRGSESIIVNGGTDIAKKPVWIEGPHIYRIKGWYYLLCAEGGTGYNHSEVVFRSKDVQGPYLPWEGNPILTQRHLDPNRPNPVTTVGHADLVETANGAWHAVFLGCRPYDGPHYNIGRETFLAPVRWEGEWPVITSGNELVQYRYPLPSLPPTRSSGTSFRGNFRFRDDFRTSKLDLRYTFLRTVTQPWHRLNKGKLELQLRPETLGGRSNPSFVGHRQQHHEASASAALSLAAKAENEKAGLVIFQNETHHYFLCQSVHKGKPVIQLFRSTKDSTLELLKEAVLPKLPGEVFLRIEAKKTVYAFSYSLDNQQWITLTDSAEARFLSTATAGGFVGCVFGLYATSEGQPSPNRARYDWFEYQGNDALFRNEQLPNPPTP